MIQCILTAGIYTQIDLLHAVREIMIFFTISNPIKSASNSAEFFESEYLMKKLCTR